MARGALCVATCIMIDEYNRPFCNDEYPVLCFVVIEFSAMVEYLTHDILLVLLHSDISFYEM